MDAEVGDQIIVRGHHVGQPVRACHVLEVRGPTVGRRTWSDGTTAGTRHSLPRQRRHYRAHRAHHQLTSFPTGQPRVMTACAASKAALTSWRSFCTPSRSVSAFTNTSWRASRSFE